MADTTPGHVKATLYVRVDPALFTTVFDLAEGSNLSMATVIEVLISKAAGTRHPHRAAVDRQITEYRKATRP
jgi:hypothetical protein